MPGPSYDEIDRDGLTERHLIAIAECIINWGKCESNLRALLTAIEGRSLEEGAVAYDRLSPEDAWKRIKKGMRERGATESVLEAVQKNRSASREYYETRKRIIHAGCVGVWIKDNDYLAYSAFERHSEGMLTLYFIPIDEILRSASFAKSATNLALKLLGSLGY